MRFPKQMLCEETAAHPNLAMDAPDRKLDAFVAERQVPGADMVVDAVDKRPVEIETERRPGVMLRVMVRRRDSSEPPYFASKSFVRPVI